MTSVRRDDGVGKGWDDFETAVQEVESFLRKETAGHRVSRDAIEDAARDVVVDAKKTHDPSRSALGTFSVHWAKTRHVAAGLMGWDASLDKVAEPAGPAAELALDDAKSLLLGELKRMTGRLVRASAIGKDAQLTSAAAVVDVVTWALEESWSHGRMANRADETLAALRETSRKSPVRGVFCEDELWDRWVHGIEMELSTPDNWKSTCTWLVQDIARSRPNLRCNAKLVTFALEKLGELAIVPAGDGRTRMDRWREDGWPDEDDRTAGELVRAVLRKAGGRTRGEPATFRKRRERDRKADAARAARVAEKLRALEEKV